ncbi:phospholipase D family protein (plasmid) [Burkholderia thailandensis]|uniref:phospholipase D family nuclease n=1 Tax=Burkholderia thailandensis TaxID=57975 RepID=UPI00192D5D39|nr:phospholipase D family protein [Burkholderia thailandensis]MBS2132325.1 phospholipase D family protein [Burkholderia thailandensis]QRA15132.1 phospholipase D family protein [Burkholderia thailandensis]
MRLLLVIAILAGFIYVMKGDDPGDMQGKVSTTLSNFLPVLKHTDDGAIRNRGLTRTPDDAAVQMASSPDGHAEELVLDVIDSAKSELDVAAYEFTDRRIAEHLIARAHDGVAVRIVLDRSQLTGQGSKLQMVAAAGIPVRIDTAVPRMHNKLIVADRENTQTGSMNYTEAGAHQNAENVIVVWHHRGNAEQARAMWMRLWNESKPYQAG